MKKRIKPSDEYFGPDSLTSPGASFFTPAQSDTVDLAVSTRGIYIGGAGNLKITSVNGDETTFVGLASGVIHPIRAKRIWVTGTTATDIIGAY